MRGERITDDQTIDVERAHVKAKPETVWRVIAAIVVATGMLVAGYMDIKYTLREQGRDLTAIRDDLNLKVVMKSDLSALEDRVDARTRNVLKTEIVIDCPFAMRGRIRCQPVFIVASNP